MTFSGWQDIHPAWRERLREACAEADAYVESGWRSSQRQKELYDCWKAGTSGCNPANPPGTSNHESHPWHDDERMSLAADCHPNHPFPSTADYRDMQAVFRRYGLIFPIASELWHAQPQEQPEGYFDSDPFPALGRSNRGDEEMVLT